MVKVSFSHLPAFWRKGAGLILEVCFFLGHVLGVLVSASAGEGVGSMLRAAVSSPVSIAGVLSAVVLPFAFSAFAVYLKQPVLLLPIAFTEAFFFSYLGAGLYRACGAAGWLSVLLVMFGSICAMPVLCWYWQRHIGGRDFSLPLHGLVLGGLLTIGFVDYYLIAPFLAGLITF